jgi:hypothetical protein
MVKIINDQAHQIENFKDSILNRQFVCDRRYRIGDPKFVEARSVAALVESFPAVVGEDTVRDECVHARGPGVLQNLTGLIQGSARLHQVIDDDNVFAVRVSILDGDDSGIAFPPGLSTDDDLEVHVLEHGRKPLRRTVVGKGHAVDAGFLNFFFQEGDGGMEGGRRIAVQIKSVLKGVEIVHHKPRRSTTIGKRGKHCTKSK